MSRLLRALVWMAIAALGAGSIAWLALSRGETISAVWLLTAAVCTYAVAYRFYAKFIAAKVFALDPARRTPAVRLEDGRDYCPTNRWIVFGHHFAAIAGPARSWARRWRLSSDFCPARCGSSWASHWAAPYRTSSFSAPPRGAMDGRSAKWRTTK